MWRLVGVGVLGFGFAVFFSVILGGFMVWFWCFKFGFGVVLRCLNFRDYIWFTFGFACLLNV